MKSKILFVFIVLSLAVVLMPTLGCNKIKEKVESMKPEIRGITFEWGEVTPSTTEVFATIKIYNPNSFTIPVKKIACDISISGIKIGSAETTDLKIEKNAEFPIKMLAKIDNTKIPSFWVEHLRHNEKSEAVIDIKATFDLAGMDFTLPFVIKRPIETNLLSALNKVNPVIIEKKAKLPILGEKTVFKISIDSLAGKWGTITLENTQINLVATIHNENIYPLIVPKLEYKVDMNGIELASGETEENYLFAPDSKKEISASVLLKNTSLDEWFVTHIKQNEKSTFNIKVSLAFGLPKEIAQQLGLDSIVVPIWEGSQSFETNILGTKNSK